MPQATGFTGQVAVVTGGASGIGASLVHALTRAGVHVRVADLSLTGAISVVEAVTGPGTATAVQLDVVDAAAFQTVVDDVVREHGRIDMLFNNAGIGVGGETQNLTVSDWDRVLDVNVRGVAHGVAAAYPVMVRQGNGHIVNTASLAGLLPAGLLTIYSTSKHAVVGLSASLRAEARAHGVKVLVVCPSAVETAILSSPGVGGFDIRRYVTTDQGVRQAMSPDTLAAQVLKAMRRDRAMLVTPRSARVAWRLSRLSPAIGELLVRRVVRAHRRTMADGGR